VYLTEREILRIEKGTHIDRGAFVAKRENENTGHTFQILSLPCPFLATATGECTIYPIRPLVCRLFPFYPEPLTGHATLLPAQCGTNLEFVTAGSGEGWALSDFQTDIGEWLADLWTEAGCHNITARAEGSP
jgi:Fe-S-cluster containining protein